MRLNLPLVALIAPLLMLAGQSPTRAQAGVKGLGANSRAQIAALQSEKASRTPAQLKLSSRLVYTLKASRNQSVGVSSLRSRAGVTGGRTLVDIKGTVSTQLLGLIAGAGGTVVSSHPKYRIIRAWLPLRSLEAFSGRGDVQFIRPADVAVTSGGRSYPAPVRATPTRAERAAGLSGRRLALTEIAGRLKGKGFTTNAGSVTSGGDAAHAAAAARTQFGVDGTGVKVGVLSDSADGLANAQALGDLPANTTVLPGQTGTGAGEGTAMMEIVHDLAPGAQLFFATGIGGPAVMAQNIIDLRAAGCDIIIDDLTYHLDDGPFQDGIVAKAVNTVTAGGALYFSSAANSGNLNDGTSGTYEGDFANGGAASAPLGGSGTVHNFGSATFDTVTSGSDGALMFWSDPMGGSGNDYDLYVLDSSGSVVDSSTDPQTGNQDPVELVGQLFNGDRLVVVKESGAADRFLHIDTLRGELSIGTSGNTRGHNASGAANAFCVAATDSNRSAPQAFTGGATNPVESFSSDGPRRIFYDATGAAITPGNFLATGGLLLQKPDVTAADGVRTTLPGNSGLNPFYGTSAAAPHAGALAALLKDFNPSLTPAQMRIALQSTALDIEAAGYDRDSGFGIVMANRMMFHLSSADITVTEGNAGNTSATFTVTLSAASTGTVTVNYATADGTATAPADYTAANGTLTFAPGETTKTITVAVVGDTAQEADETFFVNLTGAANAAAITPQITATITNDDAVGTLPSLSIDDVAVTEGNAGTSNAVFTVTLSAASTSVVGVSYATVDGTATAPADYTATNGTLSFAAGEITKTISVPIVGETVLEPDEDYFVTLSAPVNATLGAAQGKGTITNDDGAVTTTISIADAAAANEGSAAAPGSASFAVTLNAAAAQPVTVAYATANGTATAGSDFTAAAGTLTFAPGETTKTIQVTFIGDAVVEPDETFVVNLTSPTNASLADAQGAGQIINDDSAAIPTLSINDVAVTEGNAGTVNATFTVSLSAAATKVVTVSYATVDNSATAPSDYTSTSGTLTFAIGQTSKTIVVPVKGDTLVESNETYFVNIGTPVNATIADAQGLGTITNDEAVPLLSINSVTVTEGNSGTINATFTVTLSAASAQPVSVSAIPYNGTARSPGDYTSGGANLTFPAGTTTRTINVPVIGDTLDETDETFYVVLSAPVNAAIAGGKGRGTGIIKDDDGAPIISIEDVSIGEGNAGLRTAVFRLHLSAPSGQVVKISCSTSNDTAKAGEDYVAVTNQVVAFTTGQTVALARVVINGDLRDEPNETFYLNFSNPVFGIATDRQARCVILNDDRSPAITVGDVGIAEGNPGSNPSLFFTVTLSAPSNQKITVAYNTANGTARANSDYFGASGTLTFAPGETSKSVKVVLIGDKIVENDETFFLLLTGATNASVGKARATGIILNDDVS